MPSRRSFLRMAGTGLLAGLACRKGGRGRPASSRSGRPRYYVLALLSGGHDTLYTTDPKLPATVDAGVALPSENTIVEAGELRLGTHFSQLERWSKELSAVNGVQVLTANHETGVKQFARLKTNVSDRSPTVLDIVGRHRDPEQPLGAVSLNVSFSGMHSPSYFGTADAFLLGPHNVLEAIGEATPEDLEILADVVRRQGRGHRARGVHSRASSMTAVYHDEVAAFLERVSKVPAFETRSRSSDYVAQAMADAFDRSLWLIENDLTCGVMLELGLLGWDTHQRNEIKQTEMNGHFVRFFDEFMTGLRERRNRHGKLADQTVVVAGSDMGRFPRLNDMLGKDHLPQTGFLFTGPGVRGGYTFGETARDMRGMPISFATGRAEKAGRLPTLDDVGATLLTLAGVSPPRYGYAGQVFDFLIG